MDLQVIVVDRTFAKVIGCAKKFPVSYGTLFVALVFLVALNAPFDVIIGDPTLKSIQEKLHCIMVASRSL